MTQRCVLSLDTFQQVLVMCIYLMHVPMVHFYAHAFDTVHVVLQHGQLPFSHVCHAAAIPCPV